MDDLEFRIAKLALHPGDRLVVRCKGRISSPQALDLKLRFEDRLPAGVVVIIIDEGIDLAILSLEEIKRLSQKAA